MSEGTCGICYAVHPFPEGHCPCGGPLDCAGSEEPRRINAEGEVTGFTVTCVLCGKVWPYSVPEGRIAKWAEYRPESEQVPQG